MPLAFVTPSIDVMETWTTGRRLGIALSAIAAISIAFLLFAGGQVHTILSTVGSSVGTPSTVGGDTTGATVPDPAQPPPAGGGDTASTSDFVDVSRIDLQIIKTGTVDLEVNVVPDAVSTASARITALGGYVSGSQQTGDGDTVHASVTYRVPAARWEDALAAIRAVALRVVDEKTETQDVTGQVVDLGARITNLQATERALQAIMDKATKIADVLSVQSELTTVRGEIEQATADRQHLTEQAAFSTLTVGFGLKTQPAVVVARQGFDPQAQVDRASAKLVDILQAVATAGIWFGIVWLPVLLAVGIIALLLGLGVRWGLALRDGTGGGRSGPPGPGSWADVPPGVEGR